jgi:hypothetical protein
MSLTTLHGTLKKEKSCKKFKKESSAKSIGGKWKSLLSYDISNQIVPEDERNQSLFQQLQYSAWIGQVWKYTVRRSSLMSSLWDEDRLTLLNKKWPNVGVIFKQYYKSMIFWTNTIWSHKRNFKIISLYVARDSLS